MWLEDNRDPDITKSISFLFWNLAAKRKDGGEIFICNTTSHPSVVWILSYMCLILKWCCRRSRVKEKRRIEVKNVKLLMLQGIDQKKGESQ